VQLNSQRHAFLSAARHPNPSPIKGGGGINVSREGTALVADPSHVYGQRSGSALAYSTGEIALYIVKEGDTLSQIAEMYKVTENTIRWANDISLRGTIRPGQELLILPINGVQHTVLRGDTVASLATKYKADEDEIRIFNGIEPEGTIAVGTTLTIPGGEIAPPPAPTRTVAAASGASAAASTAPAASGYYIHPVPGAIRTQGIHGYNGIDFGAAIGTPIRASASGRVIVSRQGGWNGGYGTYIVIEHANGTQTLYAHNNSNAVSVGQQVSQGQTIGYVGNTGRSTGPHVHFEVRGARNPF
jgi:LysM repeat protein